LALTNVATGQINSLL